ncbi:MAG: copper-binding protein [Aromatoleum sp.]|jgi:Cu/Ag efflux protein CusF|uniref:copper-binding protein n=1 Tax=Aromatoleum sp. TaxID=2307007 RepID=UPI002895A326|nr:copper-binding protein [Aromatoleum sp.]MDT3670596.1 copper-binding protein [Aromatoleum sp.]
MKLHSIALTTLVATFAVATPSFAEEMHHSDHMSATPAANGEAAMSDGTVKKVDKAAGKITISHGPLANLGMPAMTMVFRAGDPAMLDEVKAGDKIRFMAEKVEGAFTVKKLEAAN